MPLARAWPSCTCSAPTSCSKKTTPPSRPSSARYRPPENPWAASDRPSLKERTAPMPMIVHADITTLLEALTAGDEDGAIHATLRLLGPENAPPAKIAARVGIPAAWAGGDGHPLAVLSVSGRVAEWMRSIPIGPEPGAETRRQLATALPL